MEECNNFSIQFVDISIRTVCCLVVDENTAHDGGWMLNDDS